MPLDEADAEDIGHWMIRAWDPKRTQKYGSEHVNERALPVKGVLHGTLHDGGPRRPQAGTPSRD